MFTLTFHIRNIKPVILCIMYGISIVSITMLDQYLVVAVAFSKIRKTRIYVEKNKYVQT